MDYCFVLPPRVTLLISASHITSALDASMAPIRWYGALVVGLSLCVACTDSSHELPRQWCGA